MVMTREPKVLKMYVDYVVHFVGQWTMSGLVVLSYSSVHLFVVNRVV